MKLVVLAVVLTVAAAAPSDTCDCAKPGDTMSTLEHLKKALGEKGGLMAKWDADCKKESAETEDWLKVIEGNSATNKADFEAREKDKGKLAGALEDRIGGLKVFIGQLKDILSKLGYHIERTNKIYGAKYDANLQDQTAASLALHDLSLDFAAPHNVRLNPIKQVKDWSGAAAATSEEAPATPEPTPAKEETAAAEAKMMFLETQVREKMSLCHSSGCTVAYQKAFQLYKAGYAHNQQNKKNFESERDTLGMFRKKTREMLDKKAAKLKKLTKQLDDLKKAMAAPDGNLSELFPYVKQHQEVFDASCKDFATSSASGKEALTALMEAITAKKAEADAEDKKEPVETPAGATGIEAEVPAAEEAPARASAAASGAGSGPKGPAPAAPKADEDLSKILESPAGTGGKFF
jgi:hypothetical protein